MQAVYVLTQEEEQFKRDKNASALLPFVKLFAGILLYVEDPFFSLDLYFGCIVLPLKGFILFRGCTCLRVNAFASSRGRYIAAFLELTPPVVAFGGGVAALIFAMQRWTLHLVDSAYHPLQHH